MRIATFNLENLGSRIGNADDFDRRLGILRPQLERLQADIVCLQEINAERTGPGRGRQLIALDRLLQDTAYGDFHRASTFHPATGYPADRHNLAILSRWPIETPAQYHHAFVLPPIHTFINAEPACSVAALDGRDDHRGAGHLN